MTIHTSDARLLPELGAIQAPAPLRDRPSWVCWRYEQFVGEAKPRKIPYWADGTRRHGTQGGPQDLARLTKFAAAREAAIKLGFDGVGFAHTKDGGVITLDFDGCVNDGVVRPDVLELVEGTYAEFSPSGTGIHALFFGPPDILRNHKVRAEGGDFAVEAFSSAGFTTFTGWVLDHVDVLGYEDRIAPLPDSVAAACQRRFGASKPAFDSEDFMAGHEPKLGLTIAQMQELLSYLDPSMPRDPWLRAGMAVHQETEGGDDGFEIWDEWSSEGDTYPGTDKLRDQWRSFRGPQPGKRLVTMASVIKMAQKAGYVAASHHNSTPARNTNEALTTHFLGSDRFQILSATELANRPEVDWLIKGVVPRDSLSMIYGKSGTGKSFVTLDLAAHIALGKDWHGRKTKQGRVVYIAAEGAGGLSKRLKALAMAMHVDIEMLDIDCIIEPPNFLENGDVDAVIERLNAHGPISLVVTDTLAQVTPGCDENASVGMGAAINNAQRIIREVNTALLLVHHAGKDENRGARGWSGLRAAVDAELEVKSRGEFKELRVTKMKDGEDGEVFAFHLEQHHVGFDADGQSVTSCSVRYLDYVPQAAQHRKLGASQKIILETVQELDIFREGATKRALIDNVVTKIPAPADGKKDNRRSNVERALRGLIENDYLIERDGFIFEKDA